MADLKDHEAQFSLNEDARSLQRNEEDLYVLARTGDLFEPDISRGDWEGFCKAAEKEESERLAYVPEGESRVTDEEKALLGRADLLRSEEAEALLEKREKLVELVRPQCVDPDGEKEADDVERLINEEFGIEDWGAIDVTIGEL